MGRRLLVCKGQWLKTRKGVWKFDQDQNIVPLYLLIGNTDQVETVKENLRRVLTLRRDTPMVVTFQLPQWMLEPDGETWPPHIINTNADVDMMLSVHEWNVPPKLCVIVGAADVATFHFRCRAPFTVGAHTFLADGVTDEQHMGCVLDMIRGNEILCSFPVLNELVDEEKLVLLYRFSLEMQKAKNSLDLNLGLMGEPDDHIVPNLGNRHVHRQGQAEHGFVNTDVPVDGGMGHLPYNTPQFGYHPFPAIGSARNNIPTTIHEQPYQGPPWGTIDSRGRYWDYLMSSRYAVELERIYGVPGSEFVGYHPNDLTIGNPHGPPFAGSPTGPLIGRSGLPIDVSSTASSTELQQSDGGRGNLINSQHPNFGGQLLIERGEPSNRGVDATPPDCVIKLEVVAPQLNEDADAKSGEVGDP